MERRRHFPLLDAQSWSASGKLLHRARQSLVNGRLTVDEFRRGAMNPVSFSNAERAEDEVENVVGGGRAGDGIEGPEGVVEIE